MSSTSTSWAVDSNTDASSSSTSTWTIDSRTQRFNPFVLRSGTNYGINGKKVPLGHIYGTQAIHGVSIEQLGQLVPELLSIVGFGISASRIADYETWGGSMTSVDIYYPHDLSHFDPPPTAGYQIFDLFGRDDSITEYFSQIANQPGAPLHATWTVDANTNSSSTSVPTWTVSSGTTVTWTIDDNTDASSDSASTWIIDGNTDASSDLIPTWTVSSGTTVTWTTDGNTD